jgi:uncharacterized phage-associated protein
MLNFNPSKVVEAILFFAEKEKDANGVDIDLIKIHKYFYFSEQEHLKTYLRPIFGDTYIAMPEGPVPSMVYDILKWLRGEKNNPFIKRILTMVAENASSSIAVYDRFRVAPLRKPNLKKFSKSELSVMNRVFNDYSKYSSKELSDLSHKEVAWLNAQRTGSNDMDFAEIINDKEAWQYIEQQNEEAQAFHASFQLHS